MQIKKTFNTLKDRILALPPVIMILAIMIIFFAIAAPNFFKASNALNLARQGSLLVILCMGVVVIKITGGIDLATGGILTFSGMLMARLLVTYNVNVYVAGLVAIVVAVIFGFLNGFLITVMKIPSFIATLGVQGITIGLSLVMNKGGVIGGMPDTIFEIGNGSTFGIPNPTIIVVIVFALTYILLNHTKFGIYEYAVGGNREALKLSGKSVQWYETLAYVYSGLMSGIASIIVLSRNSAAQPTIGQGMEFQAFAAVVLGGSYMAGKGSATGAFLGALVIIILRNGLNILGIPTYIQLAIFGIVLISAIVGSTIIERNVQKLTEE